MAFSLLSTDILKRLGVSAGPYGFIWDIRGSEMRYELHVPLGPKTPSLWEIYIAVRADI